jgi:hypothetical protein
MVSFTLAGSTSSGWVADHKLGDANGLPQAAQTPEFTLSAKIGSACLRPLHYFS